MGVIGRRVIWISLGYTQAFGHASSVMLKQRVPGKGKELEELLGNCGVSL
jgi:hypothetical protein